jgi:VIT1/CCC1 family predicted Fe2+/Mn2+ transporter
MSDSVHEAFKSRDASASRAAHKARRGHGHSHSHSHNEKHTNSGEYLKEMVLGGTDGIVTTFAVVAGVEGANLAAGVILVLGIANILADGLSMAIGNYLGSKAEQDFYDNERAREGWEIDNVPEHEKDEIREIYAAKGFEGELLEQVVAKITENKERWLDVMMLEELKMIDERQNPLLSALTTFVAFLGFGAIPLLAYIGAMFFRINSDNLFGYCVTLTGIALFMVGVLRSRFTHRSWFKSGLEILTLGGAAGGVSYLVGEMLQGLASMP